MITAGTTFFADRSRRKRETFIARRLLSSDLSAVSRALTDTRNNLQRSEEHLKAGQAAADDQQWPVGWEKVAWAQSWAGYRASLAASVDEQQFGPLATAFGYIEQFQNALAAGRRPFTSDDRKFLDEARSRIDIACEAVDMSAEPPTPPGTGPEPKHSVTSERQL